MRLSICFPVFAFFFLLGPGLSSIEATSSGVTKHKHSTLEKCAQACLKQKKFSCKFFKYIKSSHTCYLSSKSSPDFNLSEASDSNETTTKLTPKPTVTTTLKPTTVTSSTKTTVKTAIPPNLKNHNGKLKKLQKKYKQVKKKEKKLKGVKKSLKKLTKIVKQKEASSAKQNEKLSSKVGKQAKTLRWNMRYLRRLIRSTIALKKNYALLDSYQKNLRGKIRDIMLENKNMSQKINLLHKSSDKQALTNVMYQKEFQKLWSSNNKVLKRILLIHGLVKKNNTLIPKHLRKFMRMLTAWAKKIGIMNNRVKRIVKVLLALKISETMNKKFNVHIVNNLGHMTRSMRVLKLAIKRLASTVVDQFKLQKIMTKETGKIPELIANQKQLASKLQKLRQKSILMYHLASKNLTKLQKEDAAEHANLTEKMNTKFSELDKSIPKLQKQVRHLQMMMANQLKIQENASKIVVKTPKLAASQKKMAKKLEKIKQKNKIMFKLYKRVVKKMKKKYVKQKGNFRKLVKKLRRVKPSQNKKLNSTSTPINIVVGKIRHEPGKGYEILKNIKAGRNPRRHRSGKRRHFTSKQKTRLARKRQRKT